jgi:L-alanine-DL-glutamate epimerase-like enolase superfamily enzyme
MSAVSRCRADGVLAKDTLPHHLLVGGDETRDGFIHLNDQPGFGVEINWDYARRYAA